MGKRAHYHPAAHRLGEALLLPFLIPCFSLCYGWLEVSFADPRTTLAPEQFALQFARRARRLFFT
jgi:hypothetical protein